MSVKVEILVFDRMLVYIQKKIEHRAGADALGEIKVIWLNISQYHCASLRSIFF